MDSEEIIRITEGVEPLSDFYPKRLTDTHPDLKAAYQFGRNYFDSSAALRRFLSSSFIKETWPQEWRKSLDLFFLVRETRFISEMSGQQLVGRSRSLSTPHPAANAGFGCSE